VGRRRSIGVDADTVNFDIRQQTTQRIERRLKSTFVTEITQAKSSIKTEGPFSLP
jgi:hypothetical protein